MHSTKPDILLFGDQRENLTWSKYTDEVVGGLSKGEIIHHEEFLEFTGTLKPTLDHGWAGLRSKKEQHDLSDYKFIELKIKTDGQPYHFQLEHNPAWQEDKLSIEIDIVANKWRTMHLEMEDFKIYNTHTKYLTRKPKLNTILNAIKRYNILASSKNAADFNFQIEYIKFH
ncbi:Complex I intermediate-associated protein 30 (CIA30) [Nonlabens sp. Hel1_33_55]|uniref:CIA30 family protein n=1 Tax=Nonlabens sp. Hel1_33_55 TaxID=1336802 RepID=UPI000875AF9B|nr:CIA30 family protein [Nonlabens sp. Hel1_33_55]SCY07851.1 Complex I intermediate-associated protein 30 (CIA30) [Nonlabens sp. Hel1_33_55]